MILSHKTALAAPEQFTLLDRFTIHFEIPERTREEDVYLWRFEGDLPEGKSELPVLIPTANMSITVQGARPRLVRVMTCSAVSMKRS